MVLRNVAKQFSFEQQRQEINEIAVDLDAINTTLTNYNVSNWNTAYSWGNHATAGYLTSYTETDPIFVASPAATITTQNKNNWDTAYSWGNHANAGYWVQNNAKISEWDTAYSWGNHANAGYWVQNNAKISEWDTAYSWGNHANAGYWVQNNAKISEWDTAYSWGNHANAGYLTSTGSIDTHNDVTISSVAENQLLRYNSTTSQWENWTPNYLTISNGNVGIGTSPSNATLHVQGDHVGGHGIIKIQRTNSDISSLAFFSQSGVRDGLLYTDNNGDLSIETPATFKIIPANGAAGTVATFTSNGLAMASGKGIDFSANANASGMTSELLDDYEEGTWTPAFSSNGATITYGDQYGYYTKIGDLVTAYCYISVSGLSGTTSNGATLTGLPFTSISNAGSYGSGTVGQWYHTGWRTNAKMLTTYLNVNGTEAQLAWVFDSAAEGYVTAAELKPTGATSGIMFSYTYRAA